MIKFNFFPFFLGWLLFSAPLAAESPDFYQALAPLKERGEAAQQATLSRVLEQVFVKLTGSRETVRNSSLGGYLGRAGQLVEQYEYRNQPVYPGGPGPLSLWARFSPDGVDRLLSKAGVVPWKNRPLVLIWMALEKEEGIQTVVNPEETPEAVELLRIHAEQRALSIMFPLLDLPDRMALSPAQLQNGEVEAARRAAERYAPGAILSGYLRHVGPKGWRGQWHLYTDGNTEEWSLDDPELPEILREAVNTLASRLAGRHGPAASGSGEFRRVELLVSPIGGMEIYHRVQNYLASLDNVRNLQVMQVDPEQVRFQLEARGGEESLIRTLALGRVLEPVEAPPETAPGQSNSLMDLFPELRQQEPGAESPTPLLHYRPR